MNVSLEQASAANDQTLSKLFMALMNALFPSTEDLAVGPAVDNSLHSLKSHHEQCRICQPEPVHPLDHGFIKLQSQAMITKQTLCCEALPVCARLSGNANAWTADAREHC